MYAQHAYKKVEGATNSSLVRKRREYMVAAYKEYQAAVITYDKYKKARDAACGIKEDYIDYEIRTHSHWSQKR